jgi:hypothetical protein
LRRLKTYLSILLIICLSWKAEAQTLTHQFTDPCTGQVTYFSVPATGTIIVFYGQSRQFTSADVASGAFAAWINQVYADYRKISPCGQQQGQVTQNQITSQIIGNTIQSVVSSIMSQAQSAASNTITGVATSTSTSNASSAGGNDAASKNNKDKDDKKKNNKNNENNVTNNSNNTTESSNNNTSGVPVSSGSDRGSSVPTSGSDKKNEEKGEEVVATTTMNIDQQNQNDAKSDSKGGGKSNARTNPLIVSSDFTTAQNLDKTFTPILNLSMSQSSMTGMSSWGVTSMIWFNFKQFALSGKYTKINFSKNGKLKWVHNINLTGVYSYGNVIGFVGYSGILNAGKWGVTGFNTSAAMTLITGEQKNTFISPSVTAFYTKPFKAGKRLIISPELYIISTPLIYSTKEKITTTDRTFSGFLGSGFDYQLTRRFKLNMNYKANLSTNPDFPILSFLFICSKINI